MSAPSLAVDAVLAVLVGLATVWDLSQRRIPNPLIVVGLLLGAALHTQASGFAGLGLSFLGAAVALAALIVPFAMRTVGGGDVKLLMVVGAFVGWRGALHVLILGTVAHGVVALAWVGARALRKQLGRPVSDDNRVPHAVGFFVATLAYTLGAVRLF